MPVKYNANVTYATLQPFFVKKTRRVARGVSTALAKNVQHYIPKHKGDAKGEWKGWETSGDLWNSIVVGEDIKRADGWKSKVRVRKGSRAEIYAAIHELGGVIFAHTNRGMIFEGLDEHGGSMGKIIRRSVTIERKAFFAQGRAKTVREMKLILAALKKGADRI